MDCNMPIMDGFMATARIKEYLGAESSKMVIVALTAYTGDQFKNKCIQEAGMDYFLTKPIMAE